MCCLHETTHFSHSVLFKLVVDFINNQGIQIGNSLHSKMNSIRSLTSLDCLSEAFCVAEQMLAQTSATSEVSVD